MMRRLFIIYNPNSSRYESVKTEVLNHSTTDFKGYLVGKFAIEKTGFEANVKKLSKLLRDNDLVLAVGGDATAAIAANAILHSGKDVTLAVLPYGNFNDLARTLGTFHLKDILEHPDQTKTLYPLEISVDGEFFRYATCYTTIGMTAEAVEIFDDQKIRKSIRKTSQRSYKSYVYLAKWYFKNRHKKVFLPEFRLNGKTTPKKVSDYCALNGRSMCQVMKGRDDYLDPNNFRSENCRLTSFPRLFMLMAKSILYRVPGTTTRGDTLEFVVPATVELQAEGEYRIFENIKKITIKKGSKCLKVIHA